MVKKTFLFNLLFTVMLLALFLPLSLQAAVAQELGEEGEFPLQEVYRMEINEVGDAQITDTITYDSLWFDEYGYIFEENPNLLTRRYRADSNVGEVEEFDVDIDSGDATITISFNTPGLAYNLSDGWTIFGYGDYVLVEEEDDEVILQAAWTVTNEFSLFEPMNLAEEVVIVFPPGASNAAFDATTGTIEYDLGYTGQEAGFLQSNRTVLIIVFAVAMAASLVLLLYVFTRRPHAPAAFATPAAQVQPHVQSQPAAAAPAARQPQPPAPKFCKKCGHPRSSMEERFCRKCGTPLQ